jgi:hypothetical protein
MAALGWNETNRLAPEYVDGWRNQSAAGRQKFQFPVRQHVPIDPADRDATVGEEKYGSKQLSAFEWIPRCAKSTGPHD